MARAARDGEIATRSARLKLPIGKRHFAGMGEGLTLIYRRTEEGFGTWTVKLARRESGAWKYTTRALGGADDYAEEANGVDVLTFAQACDKARALATEAKRDGGILAKPSTVAEAAARYLEWFRAHRKGVQMAESAVRAHIVPALGDRLLSDLTSKEIREWLDKVAMCPARLRTGSGAKRLNLRAAPKTADEKRARKASANRIFAVLKAILNRAFNDGHVSDDSAWRKAKPFAKADQARIRFLTDAESVRLVNACPGDLRALIRAALLTGARWGELASLNVAGVDSKQGTIYIAESKSGRPRYVPLNPEGLAHFDTLLVGKTGDALVFTRADGSGWGHNYHVRALGEACRVAKIRPAVTFHELRHTYASHLAQAGVDLLTISKLLGHADTRITARHYAHLADRTLAAAVLKLPSFQATTQHLRQVPATKAA